MKNLRFALGVFAVMSMLVTGCATRFSSQAVRSEIVRQTGENPKTAFELNVGRVTMALAKRVLGKSSGDGTLPLAGLGSFELAVYGLSSQTGTERLDFTAMPVRGWEPTLRFSDGARSGVVLVRASGDTIGDLVLLAADEDNALYTRLRGTLSPELPAALGDAVRKGGTAAVREELQTLSDQR